MAKPLFGLVQLSLCISILASLLSTVTVDKRVNEEGETITLESLVKIGETNVFIPCPGTRLVHNNIIWKINGYFHSANDQPNSYQPVSGGLLITVVKKEMNLTLFQCYYPKKENGLFVQESSLKTLLKITSGQHVRSQRQAAIPQRLNIDHQDMLFENETRIIAWKVVHQPISDCDHFQMVSRTACSTTNSLSVRNWTGDFNNGQIRVNYTETVLSDGVTPLYFNVTSRDGANDVCSKTSHIIQINESTITKKIPVTAGSNEVETVEIVTLPYTLNVALPVDNDGTPDCFCPIILSNEDDCDNLMSCHCFEDISFLNSDRISFQVCHSSVSNRLSLHMQNLGLTRNTRIHFYHSFSCIGESFEYRHYIDSLELIPDGPSINITTGNEFAEICYRVNLTTSNVILFQIAILSANRSLFNTTASNTTNCTEIPLSKRLIIQCATVTVKVEAYFSTGYSVTATRVVQSSQTKCSCLKQNLQFHLEPEETIRSNPLKIYVSCSSLNIEISIKISLGGKNFTRLIVCNRTNSRKELELENVNCNKENYLRIYRLSSAHELETEPCLLFQSTVTLQNCNDNTPTEPSDRSSIIAISTVVPLTICGFLMAIVLIILIRHWCIKCNKGRYKLKMLSIINWEYS